MSYERDTSIMTKCPCKKGYIVLEVDINDWGQVREHAYIDCNNCVNDYLIESKYVCFKPRYDKTIYYLVDKDTGKKIKLNI